MKGAPDVVVVGGGAAGLLAAGTAAAAGARVLLLEKNSETGKKLKIAGQGRCNITNAGDIRDFPAHYPGGGNFLHSAFRRLDNEGLRHFFAALGVATKIERGGRVFPLSDDAAEVVRALRAYARAGGVETETERRVERLALAPGDRASRPRVSGVYVAGETGLRTAGATIIATGGAAFPGTGSTGDGYALGAAAGHTLVPPRPALVPLRATADWLGAVQGLSLRNVRAALWVGGRRVQEEFGEMIFAHFGLSGPIILLLSRAAVGALEEGAEAVVRINLKPALTAEQTARRLDRDLAQNGKKHLRHALLLLLPRRLVPVLIALAGLEPERQAAGLTREERRRLAELLQDLPLRLTGHLGFSAAVVTAGGINLKEVDPATMASKCADGLFWAGEVLDVDGVTGGYNLQAAFSTAFVAGQAAAARKSGV
ncbi:MAG: NAD(P)/FAD-dependent oxidoreductase [Gracilibacteraceae bacterium]|nr:NAD(P)/FAD-dependent oxidoreductase [Gracilibacteraceae bacterium]